MKPFHLKLGKCWQSIGSTTILRMRIHRNAQIQLLEMAKACSSSSLTDSFVTVRTGKLEALKIILANKPEAPAQ